MGGSGAGSSEAGNELAADAVAEDRVTAMAAVVEADLALAAGLGDV
jgi:hypothetical protein